MGRTRSRPPRHVREAAKTTGSDVTGGSTAGENQLAPAELEVKLSQQQLARKWELQWRSTAAHGAPHSYGKSCGGWVRKKDAKRGIVYRWRWSTVLPPGQGGTPSPAGQLHRHRFRQMSSDTGLGASPAFTGRLNEAESVARLPVQPQDPDGEALDGVQIGKFRLPQVAVIVIFIVSGLCLDSISECLQYKALTLSVVLVLGITPLLAYPILHYGQGHVEESLLEGLAVFCVVPTTLSSGVTMVTQAKGNVSLAVLLTTITNLLGVATMPWSVSKIFAAKVPIKPAEMLFELIWLTLVPLIVGMGLREVVPAAKSFAKTNKKVLGLCQNSCILLVVLLMTSSAQPKIVTTDSFDLSCALAIAAGIHLVYRVLGYFSATAAKLEPREWVTVVLMSSQKSLPVCVSVMSALPATLRANSGLMIVPCIMAHASQLIIDSILAVRWEVKDEKQAALLPS
ncbi:BASS4 [Symbiodinium pilosum]|uniref:BASS4 protein n=1 Tax=Symbiodinium pilosum TaxID=2952 RepID=A0A812T527_SYMPI|nr:BASS4 [Symbiodinium pilosum]